MDRHKLLAGVRDFDPDLGRIVRPDWPQAAAAALLRRLYHPRLSAFHDGVLGERYAGVDRPDGDDRILVVLFLRGKRCTDALSRWITAQPSSRRGVLLTSP